MGLLINFNEHPDYIKTVNETKSLLKELIKYFLELSKKVDTQKLEEMMEQIDNPFMMLICGEYNSGKSTFINALIGQEICPIGATPTTDKISIISSGYSNVLDIQNPIIKRIDLDSEIVKNFLVVDTPGTNSIVKEHQEITQEFIHRAELILFVTSVERPFSESERNMLELISSKYGKRIVFILNKIDQKEEDEIEEIISFIEDNSIKLLGFKPKILKIASKMAYQGIINEDSKKLKDSNLNEVINEINAIYKKNALYLKLDSPLSTSLKLIDEIYEKLEMDDKIIEQEYNDLQEFIKFLKQYQDRLIEDYTDKIELIKNSFSKTENEIIRVIDNISFFKLFKSKLPVKDWKVKYNFEEQVRDMAKKINNIIEKVADDVVQDLKKFSERADDFVTKQIDKYKKKDINIKFASTDYLESRRNILEILKSNFETNYENSNLPEESIKIKKSIEDGFAASGLGAGMSVLVGGGLVAILPTMALDITGISLAAILAITSLFIFPRKKKKAKLIIKEKFEMLSQKLTTITLDKIEENIINTYSQVEIDLKPYKIFVNSERDDIKNNKEKATNLKNNISQIKVNVEKKFKQRKSDF